MSLTPEVEAEVLRVYRQTRSPFKTAKKVGHIDVSDVFAVINKHEGEISTAQERHGGFGREELRDHLVARRKITVSGWNNADPLIAKAREDYEAGTHIMATGRDGGWLLLYSIPRRGRPDPQVGYFLPEVA